MRHVSQIIVLLATLALGFEDFYSNPFVFLLVTWRTILRLETISLSGVHAEVQ